MPLNWREIELILSELSLEGCLVQKVIQNSFHSITWMLYDKSRGSFALYTETGTSESRICLTGADMAKTKTEKLQRFVQFARANIEGARIIAVVQKHGDRQVRIELSRQQGTMFIYIRLFSGPGANIIVTDGDMRILDLLYRRPKRNEISGAVLQDSEPQASPKDYPIRARIDGMTFNQQIDQEYRQQSLESQLSELRSRASAACERQLARELGTANSLKKTIELNSGSADLQHIGDLLAANVHRIAAHQTSIEVQDYDTGEARIIVLDPALSGSEHISSFYEKARKARGTHDNAVKELEDTQKRIEKIRSYYDEALKDTGNPKDDFRRLKNAVACTQSPSQKPSEQIGISCRSGAFPIVIGRTAKENDQLLRHSFKGSDLWFHTRDCPGAYVFVKCPKNKTVPLEVMLDAGNLAALYSKAKGSAKVNLFYTQVKYLRRAKDGPLGLVLPTHEKNLTIAVDRKRAESLLGTKEFSYE